MIGLREVDSITQEMQKVMRLQGFNGTVAEYYTMLKEDSRFKLSSKVCTKKLENFQDICDCILWSEKNFSGNAKSYAITRF